VLEICVASPQTFTIALGGELTIRAIAEAHARLVEAIAENSAVTAQIASDATVDLTFVQLMESARRAAGEAGGELSLAEPAGGLLLQTLQRGGFLADPARRQFWLKTSEDQ
jgi:hypothetical protein